MLSSKDLEKQAICPHEYFSKEVIMGQKTGDIICNECGEVFMRSENILPPEHRNSIIASVHALLIAKRANPNLKLVKKYEVKYVGVYDWALVDSNSSIGIPVLSTVANKAISAGLVKL